MDYSIQQLEDTISISTCNNNTDFREIVYKISGGCLLSLRQANKLQSILERNGINQLLSRDLQKKLWESVCRARESFASTFYANAGKNVEHINGIDFRKELFAAELGSGTVLYQWCMMVKSHGEATLYDPNSGVVTVGEYFSFNKVPVATLGANYYYDLYEAEMLQAFSNAKELGRDEKAKAALERGYVSTAERTCFQFTLPFPVRCLVSVARKTFDTWSVQRDTLGNRIEGYGKFAQGGEQQVFVPLTPFQKRQFAEVAQLVK